MSKSGFKNWVRWKIELKGILIDFLKERMSIQPATKDVLEQRGSQQPCLSSEQENITKESLLTLDVLNFGKVISKDVNW